jgi:arylsulfatase
MYFPDQEGGAVSNPSDILDGKQYDIADPAIGTGKWYSTDLFVDYSIKYIKEAACAEEAIRALSAFCRRPQSLMAPAEDIARFKGNTCPAGTCYAKRASNGRRSWAS